MDKYSVLKQYFGHRGFREGQEGLVDCLRAGRDVLGVMPTGGGKSVCYQVPALLLSGVTLVVSPLISLMKDQVMALKSAGVPAAYLNSSLSPAQMATVYRRMAAGAYKIIYVAPERLESPGFVAAARALDISLLAVDEAHCISQWGQDFRPSYRKIPQFLAQLPRRPVVGAFTATATPAVRRDITEQLELRSPYTLVTGFDRPNLYFEVQTLRPVDKPAALRRLLSERRGQSGIVYCSTRSGVERVCADLTIHGFNAGRYHAGLPEEERSQNQDDFQFDRVTVMVATNAFGMGIDKSNVSFVIHYNMPKSLEAYYQEAGRDGERADCILLFSPEDIETARYLIENGSDNPDLTEAERAQVLRQERRRLEAMVDYCETRGCLRGTILDYFGQQNPGRCDNCSSCLAKFRLRDVTREAQMILSCLRRAENALGQPCPPGLAADILHGSQRSGVTDRGLDQLTTYGLMRNLSMARIMELTDLLSSEGLTCPTEEGGLELTPAAEEVLFQGRRVLMPVEETTGAKKPRLRAKNALQGEDARLFAALKKTLEQVARRESIPAYVIFSTATLKEMARNHPHSTEELMEVNGVSRQKAQRYGQAFLEAIAAFEEGPDR